MALLISETSPRLDRASWWKWRYRLRKTVLLKSLPWPCHQAASRGAGNSPRGPAGAADPFPREESRVSTKYSVVSHRGMALLGPIGSAKLDAVVAELALPAAARVL